LDEFPAFLRTSFLRSSSRGDTKHTGSEHTRVMVGRAPEGKGDAGASGSGSSSGGGDEREQANHDNASGVVHGQNQQMSVVGGDVYSVGFIMILVLLGLMKAAANRCTC
jgi:hypothetical protein